MNYWKDHIAAIRSTHNTLQLAEAIHDLYLFVSKNQPKGKISMSNDPLAEVAVIKAAYEALLAKVHALIAAASNTTDTVSPDVQTALDELAADAANPTTPPASTPTQS